MRAHRARGRLRCGPSPPERGGTHQGGLGTPLEGTYFQAEPGNAICVQSLDDSLNSAIHITYHISLRSSSLREPRYPSTGVVVWIVVSARTHETPQKAEPRARTRCGVGWSAPTRRRTTGKEDAPDRRARSPSHKNVKRRHGRMPTTPAHTALEGRPGRARGERRPNLSRRAPLEKTKRVDSHGVRNGYR